jgi:hypothetical protein
MYPATSKKGEKPNNTKQNKTKPVLGGYQKHEQTHEGYQGGS